MWDYWLEQVHSGMKKKYTELRLETRWEGYSILNNISYHGAGAIKEIPGEIKRRGYGKALVCSDPDLVSFSVTAKAIDELDA